MSEQRVEFECLRARSLVAQQECKYTVNKYYISEEHTRQQEGKSNHGWKTNPTKKQQRQRMIQATAEVATNDCWLLATQVVLGKALPT